MATNAELLALFGDDFQDVLAGLQNLPAEARELLDRSMAKMLFDAEVFGSRVNKAVQGQRIAGISDDLIKAGLLEDMQNGGRVFGEIRNQVKGSLVEGINQSSRAGTFQALDPDADTLFTWITVAGHKICQDCAPRGGQRKTLKEWEELGLPASGWSVCRGYCYCILDPSGKISPRLEMEGVVEKGATIRKKPVSATATVAIDKSLPPQERLEKFIKEKDPRIEKILGESKDRVFLSWSEDLVKKHGAVAFDRTKLANLKIIADAVEDTLGKYGIKVDHLGYFKRGMQARRANAAAWGRGDTEHVIGWKRSYVSNPKNIDLKTKDAFIYNKEVKIANAEYALKRLEEGKRAGTIAGDVDSQIKETKARIKMMKSKNYNKFSVSSSVEDRLYATSKHECWHQVDYQLYPKGPLCGNRGGDGGLFMKMLKKHNVDRLDWYHVSEYAGSSIYELWAETGTALDMGLYVPEGIKKAFIDTIKAAGRSYP